MLTLCGVNPRCPTTGMPAWASALTLAARGVPPSSLTALAPAFMRRTALASACSGPASYVPKGRSATTSARLVARATERVATTISSSSTGSVESCPSMTLPMESPTSSRSVPAASRIRAVTAS